MPSPSTSVPPTNTTTPLRPPMNATMSWVLNQARELIVSDPSSSSPSSSENPFPAAYARTDFNPDLHTLSAETVSRLEDAAARMDVRTDSDTYYSALSSQGLNVVTFVMVGDGSVREIVLSSDEEGTLVNVSSDEEGTLVDVSSDEEEGESEEEEESESEERDTCRLRVPEFPRVEEGPAARLPGSLMSVMRPVPRQLPRAQGEVVEAQEGRPGVAVFEPEEKGN